MGNMRIWRGSKKGFDVDKHVDLNTPSLDFTTKNGDFINKHDGIVGIWWDNDENLTWNLGPAEEIKHIPVVPHKAVAEVSE